MAGRPQRWLDAKRSTHPTAVARRLRPNFTPTDEEVQRLYEREEQWMNSCTKGRACTYRPSAIVMKHDARRQSAVTSTSDMPMHCAKRREVPEPELGPLFDKLVG
jgi:hypothetical protein